MDKDTIAVVDFNDYISGDPDKKATFVKTFGDSFSNMGFAIVRNHGVTPELRAKLLKVSKAFFNLSGPVKIKYEDIALAGQRGYISKNRESAKGQSVPDIKEFYHIGQTVTDNDPVKTEYPENIWPEEVAEFKAVCETVYSTFEQTGKKPFKGCCRLS